MVRYHGLMTTTITEMARQAILSSPRRAQFESHLTGELTPGLAGAILRQLTCTETDETTVGDLPRERRNTSGGNATSSRSDDASEKQMRYALDLLRTRLAPGEEVIGTVKTAEQVIAQVTERGAMHRKLARDVIDFYKDRARVVVAYAAPAPAAKAEPKAGPATSCRRSRWSRASTWSAKTSTRSSGASSRACCTPRSWLTAGLTTTPDTARCAFSGPST